MNLPIQNKKQERLTLIIMALVLVLVLLVSKFVLGINFSLMEHGSYVAFGYHEIRGDEIWAMSFDSFSGTISAQGTFPENAKRRLLIHSGTETGELELEVESGEEEDSYTLDGRSLDLLIPGDNDDFTITLTGTEVLSGYFSAVWE